MKLGEPVNLDNFLGKGRERVYRIGVELEGGWNHQPQGIVHDGSVHIDVPPDARIAVGEVPSPPLDMKTLATWMKKFYPQYMNASCGMHVHMSFKNALNYQRLMTVQYPSTIVAYMRKWAEENRLPQNHPIWERLAGRSRFCQHLFFADEQARKVEKEHNQEREGHRYTVINYCWARVQTLECRLLPMMETPEMALSAINHLVRVTNAFLVKSSKQARKEKKIGVIHIAEEDVERLERRSYV